MTVRMAAVRRGSGAVTAAVLTALLVAACGGESDSDDSASSASGTEAPQHTRGSSPSTSSASTTPAPEPAVDEIDAKGLINEAGIWMKGCGGGSGFQHDENTPLEDLAGIFDVETGEISSVRFEPVPQGEELESIGCFGTGTPEEPTMTTVGEYRTPASGVQGESTEFRMTTYGSDGSVTERGVLECTPKDDSPLGCTGEMGIGGNILFQEKNAIRIVATNGNTVASIDTSGFNSVGSGDKIYPLNDRLFLTETTTTGQSLLYDGTTGDSVTADDHLINYTDTEAEIFDQRTDYYSVPDAGGLVYTYYENDDDAKYHRNSVVYYLSPDGKSRVELARPEIADPKVRVTMGYAYVEGVTSGLRVIDISSGGLVLSRSGDEWESLNVSEWYAAGKYLYLESRDGDSVVDVTTGEIVAESTEIYSVADAGGGWTLVGLDRNGFEWSLVRTPDGYKGPWY
ncbi:hypothetical protein [Corynebacterium variabile]|uniref:hypothetical protein n=1 Tax=Corynebacterium variabile TaxID=1727 RepID=UPI003A93693E